jgi:cyanophycinase-like exopeptidase
MVKLHRSILASAPEGERSVIDTSFGFQANADDLTDKIREYFAQSVGSEISPATWRRRDDPTAEREKTLAQLARSAWVFAGPGSPSYALKQWADTGVPRALTSVVEGEGTLVFGSAAAVTIGSHSLPVYEIYKVGADPYWDTGLNLLEAVTGISAAVIPHYDNREGGRHDTRFCYMGETRLLQLEQMLPAGVGILGVDEHTAVVIDGPNVEVHGAGTMTARYRDHEQIVGAGRTVSVEQLKAWLRGEDPSASIKSAFAAPASEHIAAATDPSPATGAPSLRGDAAALRERFDAAVSAGDADEALTACLELDDLINAWSADTLQGEDRDIARATLRAMLVDLAAMSAAPRISPRELLDPIVSVALTARAQARTSKDFAMSDLLRDGLLAAGIEVRDTPAGTEWELKEV